MNKIILTAVIISGILLTLTFGHFVYQKATSFACSKTLPAEYLLGSETFIQETKCNAGILAKLNPEFPIS